MGFPRREMVKEENSEIWTYFYPLLLEKLMEKDNKLAGFVASRLKSFKWVWLELNTELKKNLDAGVENHSSTHTKK